MMCENLLKVNLISFAVTSTGRSCFAGCINLKIVVSATITNTILQKTFLNDQSVINVYYDDDLTENLLLEDNEFGMDLPFIKKFDHDTQKGCCSLIYQIIQERECSGTCVQ